jgi:hypothetical protein
MIAPINAYTFFLITAFFLVNPAKAQERTDRWLEQFLQQQASPPLQRVLDHPDSFQYQVIYTQINRDKNNVPRFKSHYLRVDRNRYFYPASTVKLPVSLLALEKLNAAGIPGVNKHTAMLTDSAFSGQTRAWSDSTAENHLPSIAHYIRKIFIVSDNDAYNRLYEFVGQQAINEQLWKKGYSGTRITHRFVRLTPEENRHTNPIRFTDGSRVVFYQPAAYSKVRIDTSKRISVGRAYLDKGERLVNAPMDFTKRNRFPLEDLQQVLQSVLFPASVPDRRRFNLSKEDEQLLLRAMSEYPSESKFPRYDTAEFFDSYTKFFFFRDGKTKIPSSIRIFNKAGWSYGFLTDVAYIVDFEHGVEFMLSGVVYVNRDGVLNDDKYDYETIGWPFFKAVGKAIYEFELQRRRKYRADLSRFRLDYNNK